METPLLIATGNQGKFKEIASALSGLSYGFKSLKDLGPEVSQIDELGSTYEANARQKAAVFFERTGWLTLGEDSGLEIEALAGELGVTTRRWGAGESATDEAWLSFFLNRMKDFTSEQRTARFVCCAALHVAPEEAYVFWGETRGTITFEPEAPLLPGLPLSSVFKPEGFDRVYAALSAEEKNQISHRGQAVGAVRSFLEARGF